MTRDRVGLGWRPELSAGILANLHRIDVVEVIADDWFTVSKRKLQELKFLASQVPVQIHGVGLGMASTAEVAPDRLASIARLCSFIDPESWSEHLAFVRSGDIELHHLAAPPRNEATVEGTLRNLAQARCTVGTLPAVENIATIILPPGSTMGEAAWIESILAPSDCNLLLDLHNLYANDKNFGGDTCRLLDQIDRGRVSTIHIAGGSLSPEGRVVDDHLHDSPDEVHTLLAEAASRSQTPLTVILERDGRYPSMESILAEPDRARLSLTRGRRTQAA